MAIRLTPRQQKADFSAFDTTSRFESGLEGVSRAVGRIAGISDKYVTSKKRKEDDAKAELEKKRKEAQALLARESDVARSQEFSSAKAAYGAAVDSGDQGAIDKALVSLKNVASTPLPNYAPTSLGGNLDDPELISKYDAAFKKQTSDYYASLGIAENQRVIVNNADNQLTDFHQNIVTSVNESGSSGFKVSKFDELLSHRFLTNEKVGYRNILTSLTQDGADAYRSSIRSILITTAVGDFEDTIDPKKLDQKIDRLRTFISENPELEFTVDELISIDDAYKQTAGSLSDPKQLVDATEKMVADAIPSFETFAAKSFKTPSEALQSFVEASELLEDVKEILPEDNASRERLEAVVGLLRIFTPEVSTNEKGEVQISTAPTTAQNMLQEFMDSNSPEEFRSVDVLSQHVNVVENNLDSSAISKLSDWLGSQETAMLNEIKKGDTSFIRRLSPVYDMLYTKAQSGDKGARAMLEQKYKEYAKKVKKGFGFTIPRNFHIPQQDPMPEKLDQSAILARMQNELKDNSPISLAEYSAANLNNGVSTIKEQAYYQLAYAYATSVQERRDTSAVEKAAGYLDASERATEDQTDILKDILNENETFLSVTINSAKLSQDVNFAGALSKFLLGVIVSSDATKYDDVVEQVKAIEKEVFIPLFGYTTETESSAPITTPGSIISKYGDFDQIPYFKGMFARLGATYTDKIDPRRLSEIYSNSVYGLIAQKYNINTAERYENIERQYAPEMGGYDPDSEVLDSGMRSYYVDFLSRVPPAKNAKQQFNRNSVFYKALIRGLTENTFKVGVEERPVSRISLPVTEINSQGVPEQRIYLETAFGDRAYKKTSTEDGELMYITLSEVDRLVGKVVSRYVNPIDVLLGREESVQDAFSFPSNIVINTVIDEMRLEAQQGVLD